MELIRITYLNTSSELDESGWYDMPYLTFKRARKIYREIGSENLEKRLLKEGCNPIKAACISRVIPKINHEKEIDRVYKKLLSDSFLVKEIIKKKIKLKMMSGNFSITLDPDISIKPEFEHPKVKVGYIEPGEYIGIIFPNLRERFNYKKIAEEIESNYESRIKVEPFDFEYDILKEKAKDVRKDIKYLIQAFSCICSTKI